MVPSGDYMSPRAGAGDGALHAGVSASRAGVRVIGIRVFPLMVTLSNHAQSDRLRGWCREDALARLLLYYI